jgi:hypothetical protein
VRRLLLRPEEEVPEVLDCCLKWRISVPREGGRITSALREGGCWGRWSKYAAELPLLRGASAANDADESRPPPTSDDGSDGAASRSEYSEPRDD